MNKQEMIIEYIRKGYPGKRIVKGGVEYFQRHSGPRIGVFVALNDRQFGWSLVHLKGENREPVKNISWKKGIAIAVSRAEGKTGEKIPDSIKRQFGSFQIRAKLALSEKLIPVEGMKDISVTVASDGISKHFGIAIGKKSRIKFMDKHFLHLFTAMQRAIEENFENPKNK